MASWILEDSILTPSEKVELNYSGPDPIQFYKKMDASFLVRHFEVGVPDVWEREYRWGAASDPRPFYIRIFIQKGFDNFTTAFIEIIFHGEQPSDPTKGGKVKITIGGNLRTEFKLDTQFKQTPFYRGLLWLYVFFFYQKLRRNYLKICKEKIDALLKELRSWGGMLEVVYV
ncbi:MAG: hypothetical protein QXG39_02655 [Candidatus Aenigmatarchaeota archaeon]